MPDESPYIWSCVLWATASSPCLPSIVINAMTGRIVSVRGIVWRVVC